MIIGPLQWKGEFEPLWYRRGVLWSLKKMTPGLWFGFFRILKGNTIKKGNKCFFHQSTSIFVGGFQRFSRSFFIGWPAIWVFPKIVVSPKWMVKIMKNPMNKWMIWGENPLFSETHIWGMKNAWRPEGCWHQRMATRQPRKHQHQRLRDVIWSFFFFRMNRCPVGGEVRIFSWLGFQWVTRFSNG